MSDDLSRVVSELDARLRLRAREFVASPVTIERSLTDIVRSAGWKKRTRSRMERLRDALDASGIRCAVDVTDLRVPASTVVRFSRVPAADRPAADVPPPGDRRVFLSYGRRDAAALADRLFSELQGGGLDPWKDTLEIRGGSEWENVIRAGIEGSEALIAVLTPASVRTATSSTVPDDTDSVCLDEIAYARYKTPPTPIVPVMAIPCQPPLAVFRLDYVDLTGWNEPGFDWDARLKPLFEGLQAARNGEELFRPAADRLRPWDFEPFIERKRRNFFGRGWLFDSILARLDSAESLLVIGDPGIGKTAAMAEFVHRNFDGKVDAYHFCRAGRKATLEPGRFVRSVAAMFASRHRAYAARLEAGDFWEVLRESESDADPRTALESGVLDPLNEIDPPDDGFRVLMVDSLDEALRIDPDTDRARSDRGGLTVVDLLESQLEVFPPWLRLLATTRRESEVLDPLLGVLGAECLDAGGDANVDDLRKFIEHRTASGILRDKVTRGKSAGVDVIGEISEAADGNFLYAAQVLDALETGRFDVTAMSRLPVGLSEQYRRFFKRRYRSDDGFDRVRPVLECIVAGQEPVPETDLALATGLDIEYDLPGRLDELSEFLRVSETTPGTRRFFIFHKSLTDWLIDPNRRGKAFRVSERNGHRGLAEAFWKVYESDPGKLSDYGLAHLPDHLAVLARSGVAPDAGPGYAARLVRFALDDRVQDLRVGDPQGIRRAIGTALQVAANADVLETTPGAIAAAIGLPVFNGQRLDPGRLAGFAAAGDIERLRSELDLYPVDATWRGAILVTLAWHLVGMDKRKARAVRDEAAREISESGIELQRLDEYLSTGTLADRITRDPTETRILALLAQVGGTDFGEHIAEDLYDVGAELRERQFEAWPTTPHLVEGVRGRRASHAELFAPEFVAFAARHPDPGDRYAVAYIDSHSQNTYRHYRRSALRFVLLAVLDHPDPAWILPRLEKIFVAELSASNPEFTESAPAALASVRCPTEFETYVDEARQAAANLPRNPERGQGDTWASHQRRLGAAAEATARGRGDGDDARQLLRAALDVPYGFAGFRAPASLTLAESILVVGGDPGTMIEDALAAARTAAHHVFDLTFAVKITSRCNAMIEDWWPGPADVLDVIERFTADPTRPEFAALHIVGWVYDGRRQDTEPLSDELMMTEPSLVELARVYSQPVGEFRRLNPELTRSDGLPPGTRVRVPDSEFAPMLAGRLAAEALVALPDTAERALAIRRLLPIAVDNVTMLDVVLGRLILAIAPLPGGPGLLDEIRAELVRWVPQLPEPKASARGFLEVMG